MNANAQSNSCFGMFFMSEGSSNHFGWKTQLAGSLNVVSQSVKPSMLLIPARNCGRRRCRCVRKQKPKQAPTFWIFALCVAMMLPCLCLLLLLETSFFGGTDVRSSLLCIHLYFRNAAVNCQTEKLFPHDVRSRPSEHEGGGQQKETNMTAT